MSLMNANEELPLDKSPILLHLNHIWDYKPQRSAIWKEKAEIHFCFLKFSLGSIFVPKM
jgi:hypothetical protein